ncbi:histone-like nucleoid-structuring protein Lsr2 [Actinoalloteichus caeruleus]|uniref:histone-like nucleoid-structuring protein Lsr2 n=1 Tax=Actinoalloteichus cyanogriseus TaxID=2893586 RepID=UPI0005566817|nr:Lsr2 family protein [Actinoalloteichus caeruleus]
MAERVCVELVDDLDGAPAQSTVQFALDGVNYEIDLSDRNASHLREVFRPYVERARAVTQRNDRTVKKDRVARNKRRADQREATQRIREVAERGRAHQRAVREAEEEARRAELAAAAEASAQELALSQPAPAQEAPAQPAADPTRPTVSLPQFSSATG